MILHSHRRKSWDWTCSEERSDKPGKILVLCRNGEKLRAGKIEDNFKQFMTNISRNRFFFSSLENGAKSILFRDKKQRCATFCWETLLWIFSYLKSVPVLAVIKVYVASWAMKNEDSFEKFIIVCENNCEYELRCSKIRLNSWFLVSKLFGTAHFQVPSCTRCMSCQNIIVVAIVHFDQSCLCMGIESLKFFIINSDEKQKYSCWSDNKICIYFNLLIQSYSVVVDKLS